MSNKWYNVVKTITSPMTHLRNIASSSGAGVKSIFKAIRKNKAKGGSAKGKK